MRVIPAISIPTTSIVFLLKIFLKKWRCPWCGTMFRDSFKYYKSRCPLPDLKDVIDLSKPDYAKVTNLKRNLSNESCERAFGLRPVRDWKIYEFIDVPGLIFIQNPFTPNGQKYWIIKCLKDYTRKPNKLNLDIHNTLTDDAVWWDVCFCGNRKGKTLIPRLRWTTLGYHHNWDTKVYSEDNKTEMPTEVSILTGIIAKALGFEEFNAEAAIVNYYRMNSTLAGHTDHSEVNLEAPLFSISFGQTAIFLIGGVRQEDPAHAMFLRSGDIVVMSGKSRLRYHGVPKILSENILPCDDEKSDDKDEKLWHQDDWKKAKAYISEARINMNIRQVLKCGQLSLY